MRDGSHGIVNAVLDVHEEGSEGIVNAERDIHEESHGAVPTKQDLHKEKVKVLYIRRGIYMKGVTELKTQS